MHRTVPTIKETKEHHQLNHRDSSHPPPIIQKRSKGIEISLSKNFANVDNYIQQTRKAMKLYNAALRETLKEEMSR